MSRTEERNGLDLLPEAVWDIEAQWTRAKAERAALMSSLQAAPSAVRL